jgi:hypothetical protein
MNSLRNKPHFAWIGAALMLTASLMALFTPRVYLAENKADRQYLPLQDISDVPLPGHASRFNYESGNPDRHLWPSAAYGEGQQLADPCPSRPAAMGRSRPVTTGRNRPEAVVRKRLWKQDRFARL